jgi:hypothetical protein
MKKTTITFLIAAAAFWTCKPAEKEVESIEMVEEIVLVEHVWVIDEHHLNETPITNHPTAKPRKKTTTVEAAPEIPLDDVPYKSLVASDFIASISQTHEIENPIVEISEVVIPLDETQTVASFNKKGNSTGSVQVVSNAETGEIDHIIFQDKNHKDYYDVQAGMSGKEVRKLRKEMKHMAHKGQVFFYSDDSNIMYLTDIKYADGEEIVEADVDESLVTAVIWKEKSHKDHPKHAHHKK